MVTSIVADFTLRNSGKLGATIEADQEDNRLYARCEARPQARQTALLDKASGGSRRSC